MFIKEEKIISFENKILVGKVFFGQSMKDNGILWKLNHKIENYEKILKIKIGKKN